MTLRILALVLALTLAPIAHAADDLLDVEKAFALTARALDDRTLELNYKIAKGYYLYRERFEFKAEGATLGAADIPPGKRKKDEFFGEVETYRDGLRLTIPIAAAEGDRLKLFATSQGCADVGVCYPPYTHEMMIKVAAAGASSAAPSSVFGNRSESNLAQNIMPAQGAAGSAIPASDEARFQGVLSEGRLWTIIAIFFAAGLALTFTPCVLPMIPILSGIIAGGGHTPTRMRGFILSVAYVAGVAVTYTLIGVAAALSGSLLSAALQNAWVLGTFALIFVVLSLSMFGLYEMQLPQFVSSRVNDAANRLEGGRIGAVAAMGALSAAIVSPCVAAPLAGALLYISQSRDVLLGGSALFAMAMGMGVPLIAVGTFESALLPKAGAWMETVKKVFGVLLLGVAIWIVSPVIPAEGVMLLWGALAVGVAMFLRAIDSLPGDAPGVTRLGKAVGVLALIWGAALVLGAAMGSRDPLAPLAAPRTGLVAATNDLKFERVRTSAELDGRLASASKPVMLDFYADWCVSCKEMERYTFHDDKVRSRLAGLTLLQVDVTANSAEDKALLKRFKLFGPPGIIFFDKAGQEIQGLRVIGYQPADKFLKTLDLAGS
ncbi:MAG: protein-disulfide reductase DsbD [Burkholderiales bacterium]